MLTLTKAKYKCLRTVLFFFFFFSRCWSTPGCRPISIFYTSFCSQQSESSYFLRYSGYRPAIASVVCSRFVWSFREPNQGPMLPLLVLSSTFHSCQECHHIHYPTTSTNFIILNSVSQRYSEHGPLHCSLCSL